MKRKVKGLKDNGKVAVIAMETAAFHRRGQIPRPGQRFQNRKHAQNKKACRVKVNWD